MFLIVNFIRMVIRPFFLGNALKYLPKPVETNWCLKERLLEFSPINKILIVSYFIYLIYYKLYEIRLIYFLRKVKNKQL